MTTMTLFKVEAPKPAVGSVITCRVCERRAQTILDAPALLCKECLHDIDATARHVSERTATVYARWQRAYEAFERLVKDNPWWNKVMDARRRATLEPEYGAVVDRAWAVAKTGPHAAIVVARDALDVTSMEMEAITKWYIAAENELRAARDAGLAPLEVWR